MKDYSSKRVKELTFQEVEELKAIISRLPKDTVVKVEDEDFNNEIEFDEAVYDIQDDWFDVDDEVYESLVGKCFINNARDEIVKVIGLSKGLCSERAEYEDAYEFIYERFYYATVKGRPSWVLPDYIWLQETANYDEKYKNYCLSPLAEMNIASENMYHVGKDGKLYVDHTCGGDYEMYEEVNEHLFLYAKDDATNGGTKTYEMNC